MDISEKTVSSDEKNVEDFGHKVGTANRKRTRHVRRSRSGDDQRSSPDVEDRHRRRRGYRSRSRSGDRSSIGDKGKEVFNSSSDDMEDGMRNIHHAKGEDHSIKIEGNSKQESPSFCEHVAIMQRDRHWSEKSLDEMNQRDWNILKSDHKILYRGERIPHPLRSWDDLTVPSFVREVIDKRGYKKLTPIQMQTIPISLQNRDVVGVDKAGSGKTIAYLVPLFAWIHGLPKCRMMGKWTKVPDAIILTPTRAVARHVQEECVKFGESSGIRTEIVIGGVKLKEQSNKLASGSEVVVTTPGRLLDVLEKGILVLSQRTYVVMDEFDVMVEFGLEPYLRKIIDILPVMPETEGAGENAKKYHQTAIFTSTMPPTVERLVRTFLHDPCVVTVG